MMNSNYTYLEGGNLSGRSNHMRQLSLKDGVYIAPQLNESISGLASTVEKELLLNHRRKDVEIKELILELTLKLDVLNQLPQTLSGGEKAKLVIANSILLNKSKIFLDSTFEQIESCSRDAIFNTLNKYSTSLFLTDNFFNKNFFNVKTITDFNFNENLPCRLQINKVMAEHFKLRSTQNNVVIKLVDLSFGYKSNCNLFTDFNFSFIPGKVYHLEGKNGSGKSTLSKILCGLIQLDSPSLEVNGIKIDLYKYPGKYVSYHFQDPDAQLFSSTVLEELSNNVSKHLSVLDLAKAFGLSSVLSENPFDLPLSIRKRLALASSLSIDRAWYILDEPTLFQDQKTIREMIEIIKKLRDAGKGVVIISHCKEFIGQLEPETLKLSND